jgi:hypothetical protein
MKKRNYIFELFNWCSYTNFVTYLLDKYGWKETKELIFLRILSYFTGLANNQFHIVKKITKIISL